MLKDATEDANGVNLDDLTERIRINDIGLEDFNLDIKYDQEVEIRPSSSDPNIISKSTNETHVKKIGTRDDTVIAEELFPCLASSH